MSAKRGSPEYFNQIFRNAVERGMAMVDAALDPFLEDGRPPLTQPLTLAKLKEMPVPEAEALLRAELRRTMKIDEQTGTPIPERETVRLATEYMEWLHDATQGSAQSQLGGG